MQLEDLLNQMRLALLRADYAAAAGLVPAVEAALAALPARPDAGFLRRLAALAERNTACLDGARRGLRAARQRVADIQRAASGLNTYDVRGKASVLGQNGKLAGRF